MMDQIERLTQALKGRYTIERELGSGGMATVYLADDLKHRRKVAVKVLRPELAITLGAERFVREIEVAAQLQHPHILPLHDSGEADGFLYYVMPYVDGHSLREKLARDGELPTGEVGRIVREVVDALAHAHERGVVHRDIKPDNVMLSGRHAMVTDFGVAKAVSEATGRQDLTTAGVALGTPAYMAPEQASASHIDHRADIYAVGALAYELIAGRPPFTGASAQMVLAAHLTEAPVPLVELRPALPPAFGQVVMRCLEKEPADRWQSAEELLTHLEALATPGEGVTPTSVAPISAVRSFGRWTTAVIGAGAAILLGAAVLLVFNRSEPQLITFGRTIQLTHAPGLELDPAISPDGSMVAYAAGNERRTHIYVQQVTGGRAADVTDGLPGSHRWPQWSPDGTRLVFQASDGIYVVPAPLGGTPKRLADRGYSPAWSPDGKEIIYAVDTTLVLEGAGVPRTGIFIQSVDQGDPRKVAEDFSPHSFRWSRDGARVAYTSGNTSYVLGTYNLGNIAPSALKMLTIGDEGSMLLREGPHVYVSPWWLPEDDQFLYVSNEDGTPDIYQMRVPNVGDRSNKPSRLTTGLNVLTMTLSQDASIMAYTVFRPEGNVWSIRIPDGNVVSVTAAEPVTVGSQVIEGISITRDGRWLVYDSNQGGNQDIYRLALPAGEPERLTTHPADDFLPAWSPDGREIAFYSFRHGSRDLHVMNADGRALQRLTEDASQERYPAWAPDGNRLVFYADKTGRQELYIMTRDAHSNGWSEPHQLTFDGGLNPRWSPDGQWIAYITGQTLELISPDGNESRVLVAGDVQRGGPVPIFPGWSPDAQTVYYKARDADNTASFWSVPVSGGPPQLLVRFDDPARPSHRHEFTTDGTRFFFTIDRRESNVWMAELSLR